MIYYIHGFNSGTKEDRIELLTNLLEQEVIGLEYDSGLDFNTNLENMKALINKDEVYGFIGTSLGAYYSQVLGNFYDTQVVIINPCLDPFTSLRKYLGENKNYYTDVTYNLTNEVVDTYIPIRFDSQTLAILASGDEIFNWEDSLAALKDKCEVYIFKGGAHSFANYSDISEDIKFFFNSPVIFPID